ncbi:unnamed protein product [Vicia faba]|uniref:C2 domain-containing protein n=1 Tax=Vicia faba TaxID=3906 RepID=A0AAV1AS97_VICFA|nr:unnamed protein product [Vicia faba]
MSSGTATVVSCAKLKDTEWISRQDPYVCLEYASTKFRTRTCTDGGKHLVFQEKFVVPLIEVLREFTVVVWNSNILTFDGFIGTGKVQLNKVLSQGFDDSSWPLQTKSGRHAGEVKLILHSANAKLNQQKLDSSSTHVATTPLPSSSSKQNPKPIHNDAPPPPTTTTTSSTSTWSKPNKEPTYERFCSQPPSLVTHLRSSLNNLQQLRVLDLHSNELWDDIGDLLPTLRNLEFLDLSQNQFYGGLSITLENVSSLANTVRFLNVSHNKLNGNFFLKDAIGLFRNLRALDLSDNMIRGELPSFVSLRELRVLKLASNIFFGAVPEDLLLTSMSLEELNLSSNGFTGSIGGF